MTDVSEISREISRFAVFSGRPVVSCLMGGHSVKTGTKLLKREGLPVYDDPFRAVKVIKKCTY
jgi:acyl-CoA synthetase (NDP forming)